MSEARSPLVLLTGATGFVGRQVLKRLLDEDTPVRLVVRTATLDEAGQSGVESIVHTSDLFGESPEWWAETCEGVDTIIHLAWYAEPGRYLEAPENLHCLQGTVQLARGAADAGVRRIIGIGTCFEYDLAVGTLAVDTPLAPETPYAATKAATYLALSRCLPKRGVEFAWARLFYLYGEGEDPRKLVAYIRTRLEAGEPAELTSGNQVRDYMDVTDAAARIVELAGGTEQGAVNVCSGVPITVRQLAERIADEYGRRDLLRLGVRPDNLTDPPIVLGVP